MYDKTCLIKRFRQEGNTMDKKWQRRRKRLFEILEIGSDLDAISRIYDFVSAFAIVINIIASVMYTYDHLRLEYGNKSLLFVVDTGATKLKEENNKNQGCINVDIYKNSHHN